MLSVLMRLAVQNMVFKQNEIPSCLLGTPCYESERCLAGLHWWDSTFMHVCASGCFLLRFLITSAYLSSTSLRSTVMRAQETSRCRNK